MKQIHPSVSPMGGERGNGRKLQHK